MRWHGNVAHFEIELCENEIFWLKTLAEDIRDVLIQTESDEDSKIVFLAIELAYKRGRFEQWKDSKKLFTNTDMQ